MAYLDVTLPELKLIRGTVKERVDNTVLFYTNAHEFRIRRGRNVDPYVWTFPSRNIWLEDARTLQSFYKDTNQSLYSFKFKDPDEFEWNDRVLTHYEGTKWRVTSPSGSPIFKSVTLTAKLNDVSQGAQTITIENDVPIIDIAGSSDSDEVKITGEFRFVVRFEGTIGYSIVATDEDTNTTLVNLTGGLQLREVYEYA